MIEEGTKVAYTGLPGIHKVGESGQVLAATPDYCYVRWDGDVIDLVDSADLSVVGRRSVDVEAELDESLDIGVKEGVRDLYDQSGEIGVLDLLNSGGHLAVLTTAAENAYDLLASRVRHDPAVDEVLSALEPDEAERVVSMIATVLLRDVTAA